MRYVLNGPLKKVFSQIRQSIKTMCNTVRTGHQETDLQETAA